MERYYIQLGSMGNVGLGSVFAVTADSLMDAIEEAIEVAVEVAPGLLTPEDDSTLREFPEDFFITDAGAIGIEEIHELIHVSVDCGAGKFFRDPCYMPNSYRFAALLEAVRGGAEQ